MSKKTIVTVLAVALLLAVGFASTGWSGVSAGTVPLSPGFNQDVYLSKMGLLMSGQNGGSGYGLLAEVVNDSWLASLVPPAGGVFATRPIYVNTTPNNIPFFWYYEVLDAVTRAAWDAGTFNLYWSADGRTNWIPCPAPYLVPDAQEPSGIKNPPYGRVGCLVTGFPGEGYMVGIIQ